MLITSELERSRQVLLGLKEKKYEKNYQDLQKPHHRDPDAAMKNIARCSEISPGEIVEFLFMALSFRSLSYFCAG